MKKEITEVIKSFEDAVTATGRPEMPDFSNVPEDLREYFEAQYQMVVIAEAINEGWQADWSNDEQPKYYPYFWYKDSEGEGSVSSGFVFISTYYCYSNAIAGNGSRLCFRTRALAEYAGKQFIEIWNKILQK